MAGTALVVLVADLFWAARAALAVRAAVASPVSLAALVSAFALERADAAYDVLPVGRAPAPTSRTGSPWPSRSSCSPRRSSSCCSAHELTDSRLPAGEYHFLLLASVVGALTMASSRDLLSLLVSLEVVSLPAFVLVGLRREDARSAEAALKFFVISVIATAVS